MNYFFCNPLLQTCPLLSLWVGVGVGIVLVAVFVAIYHPLILARAGVGAENVEQYSLGERVLLEQAALSAIGEHVWVGVGAGNFPWWSSYYFHERQIPVRGNNVHRYLMAVWAEVGVIGLVLVGSAVFSGYEAALQGIRRAVTVDSAVARAVLLAGFLALNVTGIVDHYTWTLPHMQWLWWGVLAVVIAQDE